jgi:hypothetical protein
MERNEEEEELTFEEKGKDPTEDYEWNYDEDELSSHLSDLTDTFQNFTRTSEYYDWCRRAWSLYFKLAFEDTHNSAGNIQMGDGGELLGTQLNHFRNLLQHRLNLTTKERPALICRARNSDLKSMKQAELGTSLIEYYFTDKNAENHLIKAVEDAILFGEGFVLQTWDPNAGNEVDADEETDSFDYEGDIQLSTHVTWNIIRDLGVREWKDHKWVGVRSGKNKWDLIARFPEHAEAIKGAVRWMDVPLEDGARPFDEDKYYVRTDEVEVLEFWHKKTPALPEGRYVMMVGDAVLLDLDMPYRDLPVSRVSTSEITLTPFPYTFAFDLIPIQELVNMCASTIASNQNAFGVQNIWIKSGGGIRPSQFMGGMNIIESEVAPEPVNLTATPQEIFTFLTDLLRHMELISGIDQVTRGYTDDNVRSGAFAALLQAQSVSFSSSLSRQYYQLLEDVGTSMLRMLRDFANEKRVITIIGKHNRQYMKYFTGDDLALIDRVTVESTNPAFNTFSGKMAFAEMLVSNNLVKTPQEILNVFQTGNVDSLLEADNAQLAIVREENEALLDGQEIPEPALEDNHVLHIREHIAVLGTLEMREDIQIRSAVQAHVLGHIQPLLTDPNAQMLQTILGYEVPFPPGAMPAGAGTPTAPPIGNQPQPGAGGGSEITGAPTPMEPDLDGRSVANMPEPAQAPA